MKNPKIKIKTTNTTQLHNLVTIQPSRNILIKQITYTQYVIPITGPIGEIDEYGELTQILANATAKDEVYIQLFSPGGSLETCDYLCRRLDECDAHIIVEIGMTCASAASAIALHADDWVIYDSSTMMIHSCSYSPGYGKESDIRSSADYTERLNREWVERTYQGFLWEDEITEALDYGKDLYLFADDLRERMPLFKQYRKDSEVGRTKETMQYWDQQEAA